MAEYTTKTKTYAIVGLRIVLALLCERGVVSGNLDVMEEDFERFCVERNQRVLVGIYFQDRHQNTVAERVGSHFIGR